MNTLHYCDLCFCYFLCLYTQIKDVFSVTYLTLVIVLLVLSFINFITAINNVKNSQTRTLNPAPGGGAGEVQDPVSEQLWKKAQSIAVGQVTMIASFGGSYSSTVLEKSNFFWVDILYFVLCFVVVLISMFMIMVKHETIIQLIECMNHKHHFKFRMI